MAKKHVPFDFASHPALDLDAAAPPTIARHVTLAAVRRFLAAIKPDAFDIGVTLEAHKAVCNADPAYFQDHDWIKDEEQFREEDDYLWETTVWGEGRGYQPYSF